MATHARSHSKEEPTFEQLCWDEIRSVLGKMPLYSGYMLEKDGAEPVKPVSGLAKLNKPRQHKCLYCNVDAKGNHQDFCPQIARRKPGRQAQVSL
jgi:hypothetical protein